LFKTRSSKGLKVKSQIYKDVIFLFFKRDNASV